MISLTRRSGVFSRATLALLAILAAGPLFAAAADDALATINIAGEQRMLSQRIVKAYLQLGLNVQPLAAKTQLDSAIRRFEANQQLLLPAIAGDPDSRRAGELLTTAWEQMRPLTSGAPTLENAQRLSAYGETVLNAAEMLVNVYADRSGVDEHRLLRLMARQRMLSQRIAKTYLLRSWGDQSAQLRYQSEDAIIAFEGVLTMFQSRRDEGPMLRQELDELALQWEWMKAALESDGALSYRLIVAESADAILASADRLAQQYQRLLAAR
ncbi:MAG TPA: type IV pili methyl-accepting chemotaxis transducer N-terminal domain-containing protein [Rhodocyclaceae bacterium]